MKALFDNHEKEENDGVLGIAYNLHQELQAVWGERFYENDICIIRKGIINTTTKKEWMRNNKNTKQGK